MTRKGLFGVVLLGATLVALRAPALKNCDPFLEDLDLTLKAVTIDGAAASEQADGHYVTDGGASIEARWTTTVFLTPPEALRRGPLCDEVASPSFEVTLVNPLTGALETLSFEEAP